MKLSGEKPLIDPETPDNGNRSGDHRQVRMATVHTRRNHTNPRLLTLWIFFEVVQSYRKREMKKRLQIPKSVTSQVIGAVTGIRVSRIEWPMALPKIGASM